MLSSIHYCRTGKDEGIEGYYNLLPREAKIKPDTTFKVKEILDAIIQTQVSQILSSPTIFKTVIGLNLDNREEQDMRDGEVSQLSHHSTYVKNLIGREVGLSHTFKFDLHSKLLSQKLVDLSKEDLLTVFYKHFIPRTLINSVVRKVNEELNKKGNTLYKNLRVFLDDENQSKLWDMNDDDIDNIKYSLTQFGALQLLIKVGVLTELSSEDLKKGG